MMSKNKRQSPQTAAIKKKDAAVQPKTILVVDDETDVRAMLEDFLRLHDFAVTSVNSAQKALDLLEKSDFDVVLADLVMPKMDGISLTKAIHEIGKDIPVLVMTGYASIEYAVESMKAGAADFITKPFDFDHVLMVINRVFETRDLRLLAEEREFYKDLSNSDGLTKISNYRHFNQVLQMEIDRQQRYNRPLTLLIIDIDDFKQYNDIHGHLVGDMVLVQIAHLLTMQIRGCDFVARYGGEEFTVILPEVTEKEALAVGRRIMRCIGRYEFQSVEHVTIGTLSVTIGIASFPKDARGKKELIEKADQALYAGKRAGKNCLCLYGQEKKIIRLRKSLSALARKKE